jgi:hypothetical protein
LTEQFSLNAYLQSSGTNLLKFFHHYERAYMSFSLPLVSGGVDCKRSLLTFALQNIAVKHIARETSEEIHKIFKTFFNFLVAAASS